MIQELIPGMWADEIIARVSPVIMGNLDNIIMHEYNQYTVYPVKENIFNSINGLNAEDIKVVILGQDPYHEPGQAHGLSFSVPNGQPLPPSLKNIYQELKSDIGTERTTGNLDDWKKQGVLLLNTVLTVREHQANSHKGLGWEEITSAILQTVMMTPQDKVFILWGNQAYNTYMNAYRECHFVNMPSNLHVLRAAHPSPLSAYRGFFGSQPFSTTNEILTECGLKPIRW